MSTLSIRIPEYLHKEVKSLAEKERVSINQFVTLALAEKLSALNTETYLSERAKLGNRDDFLKVLDKVPNREPEEFDKIHWLYYYAGNYIFYTNGIVLCSTYVNFLIAVVTVNVQL